ncbi:MAG: hypothetical protein KDD98_05585 [Sphingomonadaceae bacterium]|nr:hypothetical protein [Sphingomonadaceae bacterium]
MKGWPLRIAAIGAIAFFALTFVNASWLAPDPKGSVKLIAEHGLAQLPMPGPQAREECAATRIEPPNHRWLDNTAEGARKAAQLGTQVIGADLRLTADGQFVLFHDAQLDCRTNGSGRVQDMTLAELKALDMGHGYTPDGGKTFPFRGQGVGQIATLSEFLRALPPRTRVMYRMDDSSPEFAEKLAAALKELGRDPVASRDSFYGFDAPVDKIRSLYPGIWAWSPRAAQQCASDYKLYGWTGMLPDSCKGGTMLVTLDSQFFYWGWPNRLIARMEEQGGQIIVAAGDGSMADGGVTLPEQLGEVPSSFNGYLWVADPWIVTPALYSSRDFRTAEEQRAAIKATEERRARQ